jgi:hypothetical protein
MMEAAVTIGEVALAALARSGREDYGRRQFANEARERGDVEHRERVTHEC